MQARPRPVVAAAAPAVGTLYADAFTGGFLHPNPALMTDGVHSWTIVGAADLYRTAGGTLSGWGEAQKTEGLVVMTDSANMTVQLTQKVIGNGFPGMFFRYVDANNYLRAGWSAAMTALQVTKVVAGVETVLATQGSLTQTINDVLQVATTGANLITFKRNGVNVFAPFTDATHSTGTGAGLTGYISATTEVDEWSCQT
jgi:hypothetical protein